MSQTDPAEERVLILAPTGKDGPMTERFLAEAGIRSMLCRNIERLCEEARCGVGAIIITDEALDLLTTHRLIEFVSIQPPWSDIPLILFPANNENAVLLLKTLGMQTNATLMDRPVSIAVLTSAVRSALRARRRQYQARDLLLQLEEADRHKDLFLATLSHELRTPLTAMVGWVRLLRRGQLDAETTDHALAVIERCVGTQTQLIQDILSVSRIISGKFQMTLEPVDLIQAIENAVETLTPTAAAKNIDITMDLPTQRSSIVMGESTRLQQIVWNLLSNALKFTPAGGKVEIRVERSEKVATMSIHDTGEGISAAFLPFAFDRFRQADSSYTRPAGGLGLGLAIVRHLVELHGGTVRAESPGQGRGSTFTVSFPVASTSRAADKPGLALTLTPSTSASRSLYQDFRGMRVLIVEDDADSRQMIVTLLRNCGAEVLQAGSASLGFELFKKERLDIIISDIGMPDEDGFRLMRRIRQLENGKSHVPAIALTGYVSNEDRRKVMDAGYESHAPKPIEPEDLLQRIADLTAYRRSA